ncbi:protein disulfide oxidoreductase [Shewanella sp. SNU WT4]|nr:protein disulfide oxidoreductase [Shewanella sp. SNU WT4]
MFLISTYMQRHMISGAAPELSGQTSLHAPFILQSDPEPTLIYFWGTWCPACRMTSPAVNDLSKDNAVVSVAVSSGSNDDINQFMLSHDYQFAVINDDGELSKRWGAHALPAIYIVKQGEVQWVTSGVTSGWGLKVRMWLSQWL